MDPNALRQQSLACLQFEFRARLCAKNEASEKEAVPGLSSPSLELSFFPRPLFGDPGKGQVFLSGKHALVLFFIIKVLMIVSYYFVEHCVGISETYVALWFEYCSVLFIFLLRLFFC